MLTSTVVAQSPLRVQVLEAESGKPIPSVHALSGQYHGHTGLDGFVLLPATLAAQDSVAFSFVGYTTAKHTVAELRQRPLVKLHFASAALGELVVEKLAPAYSRSTVGEMLAPESLEMSLGQSLAETLQSVKGVSLLSSGTSGGKPVIHGMHGHRILIINNGIRQEGQQWGHDHAPEIDLSSAGVVSVLKGAEAVRYGSDALGGAIIVEQPPLPYDGALLGGYITALYATNGSVAGGGGALEGAFGAGREWAWRVQSNGLTAGDHYTPNYILNNTGERRYNLSLAIGTKKKEYGADIYYGWVESKEGVFKGAQMGSEDLLRERIQIGRPVELEPYTRSIDYPYGRVGHHLVRGSGYYLPRKSSKLTMQVAFQHDRRREYHIRRNYRSHYPALSLTLNNVQADLGWEERLSKAWKSEVGLHGAFTDNYNEAGTGVVPMIPNYVQLSGGVFTIQKYEQNHWGVEAGLRADYQFLNAAGIDFESNHYGGQHHHWNFTQTLGGYLQPLPELQIKSQIGTAWRAPHVAELYSNGVDHASGLYAVGDDGLKSERALKWISSLTYSTPLITLSVEGYLQWVHNYIYQEPTGAFRTVISGAYPLFQYRQVPATLHGLDAEVTFHPLKWLEYSAQSGMIWAAEQSTGRYLPFIPPFHFTHKLELTLPLLINSTLAIQHHYVAEQKRFDPDTDLINFAPPAYHLWGIMASTTIPVGKGGQKVSVQLAVHNLFNKEYKEYTNRARYYSHSVGRDIRATIKYHF